MGRAYDAIGNPTGYNGWTYTWTQGRRLQQASNASVTASYKYNASGIRTEKTVNGTTTKYNVVGGNVTWQKTGANNPIYFLYDASGNLWGLKYTDGNTYFYVRNVQGDIIKIVNSSGTVVVEYSYDAWGNPMGTSGTMAATLGAENPFRYRGYYFDTETGLYYLQSRYYNPSWGRFVNADSFGGKLGSLLSHNLFSYCGNNPIMFTDDSGHNPLVIVLAIVEVAAIVATVVTAYTTMIEALQGTKSQAKTDDIAKLTLVPLVMKLVSDLISKADKIKPSDIRFPANVNDFNPNSLERKSFPTPDNGMIYKWFYPSTDIVVFQWHEGLRESKGQHYHILEPHTGVHYYPGDKIPEPYDVFFWYWGM